MHTYKSRSCDHRFRARGAILSSCTSAQSKNTPFSRFRRELIVILRKSRVVLIITLDCAQATQTSAKASNLHQKWSGIWIQISGLIRIRIRMSTASLPKCYGFLWIHYPVGVSYFVECRENRPVTMRNANKSLKIPYMPWWGKWKSCPGSVSGTGLPPKKVNPFFRLVGPIITPSFNEIGWLLLQ